jgi:hypothetical protein
MSRTVFLSPYKQASVDRDRVIRRKVVGGRVIEEAQFVPPFEFSNGRYLATDDEAEELREHWGYAEPGEPLRGKQFFTEAPPDEEAEEKGARAVAEEQPAPVSFPPQAEETPANLGVEAEAGLEPLRASGGEDVSTKGEALEALGGANARPNGLDRRDTKDEIIAAAEEAGFWFPGYDE